MKFLVWAYFLVFSSMQKTAFQLIFKGGEGVPYGPTLKINPFSTEIASSYIYFRNMRMIIEIYF